MSTCSSHVLDAVMGTPAVGVDITISSVDAPTLGAGPQTLTTDADGRVRFEGEFEPGEYVVEFATGEWFAAAGRETFYPRVSIEVTMTADRPHYHVALLLSPFAYTTYRGS